MESISIICEDTGPSRYLCDHIGAGRLTLAEYKTGRHISDIIQGLCKNSIGERIASRKRTVDFAVITVFEEHKNQTVPEAMSAGSANRDSGKLECPCDA